MPNTVYVISYICTYMQYYYFFEKKRATGRVSTEFRRYGIPRNFLTSEEISAQFRRNSAKFRGIPRNFAEIAPEITSLFRGMPKCHCRGHPSHRSMLERCQKKNYEEINLPQIEQKKIQDILFEKADMSEIPVNFSTFFSTTV
jgi:hypothetical protein